MREYTYEKKLMGTDAVVSVVVDDPIMSVKIAEDAFEIMTEYEQRFSRFIQTSELVRLNTERSLLVSNEFMEVLQKSIVLAIQTKGLFNPLLQVARLGYTHDYQTLATAPAIENLGVYNHRPLDIDIHTATNRVTLKEDQMLDFGGILKGYLATKIALLLTARYPTCMGLIINIGGDLHTTGYDEQGQPFVFDVFNPITKEEKQVALTNTSLVTSGTYRRTWATAAGRYHHIVAPDGQGNPEAAVVSVSVVCHDGAVAEAYAKAVINSERVWWEVALREASVAYQVVYQNGCSISNNI